MAASPSERVREFWMWPHRRVEAMLRSNQSNHKPTRWLDGDNFTHNNRVRSTIETCWVGNTAMVEQRRKSRTRDGGGSPLSSHRSLAHFTTHLLSLSRLHVGSTLADRATKMKIVNGLAGSTDFSLACCWTVSAANGSARCLGASNRKKVVIGDATKNTHTRALSLTEHTPKQKSNNSHREHS